MPYKQGVAGSNPARTTNYGSVAQWIEQGASTSEVVGSSPTTPVENKIKGGCLLLLFRCAICALQQRFAIAIVWVCSLIGKASLWQSERCRFKSDQYPSNMGL